MLFGKAQEGDYILVLINNFKSTPQVLAAKIVKERAYPTLQSGGTPFSTKVGWICKIDENLISPDDKKRIQLNYDGCKEREKRPWRYFIVQGTTQATYDIHAPITNRTVKMRTRETDGKKLLDKQRVRLGMNGFVHASIISSTEVTKEEYQKYKA
jgi:hypothetical protein